MINIRHIGIVVKNLQESMAFYSLLGFHPYKFRSEFSSFISLISDKLITKLTTVRLILPNKDMIELLDYGEDIYLKSNTLFDTGIAHFAMTVGNIDLLYCKLKEEGIEFLSAPQNSPDGKAIVVFCVAPEGTFIELVEELK